MILLFLLVADMIKFVFKTRGGISISKLTWWEKITPPLDKNSKIFFSKCAMKTKQIMYKSMKYGGPDAFSLTSVGHFLMKILNLEKKVENCAGTVWKALKFPSEISEDSITPRKNFLKTSRNCFRILSVGHMHRF